ncbi:hypothetical protein DL95DRAFT_175400 [Leptodontidium sp. 2 PMI_412]|nr:hypothetical protein DL95DRAFT_175400 [Leptodontidium sp. 2 PMI_412]
MLANVSHSRYTDRSTRLWWCPRGSAPAPALLLYCYFCYAAVSGVRNVGWALTPHQGLHACLLTFPFSLSLRKGKLARSTCRQADRQTCVCFSLPAWLVRQKLLALWQVGSTQMRVATPNANSRLPALTSSCTHRGSGTRPFENVRFTALPFHCLAQMGMIFLYGVRRWRRT